LQRFLGSDSSRAEYHPKTRIVMRTCRPRSVALLAVLAALAFASPAAASYNAGIAALQVALQARGLYSGTIDGVKGAGTTNAVKRFQRGAGLRSMGRRRQDAQSPRTLRPARPR
jgi:hypothetical protein